MKLSIIVPVYNVENYIEKCMDSLLNQTYHDVEILLVNDGTQDQSIDRALGFNHEKLNNVIVLTKPNGGLSDARNFGINHASGDFLAFVDADDYVDYRMFKKMMNLVREDECDVVCCDMMYVNPDGSQGYSSGGDFDFGNVVQQPELLLINNSACNKIFKRNLFVKHRFPKGLWYEDLATIPLVLSEAKKIGHVKEPLYYYVQRSSSIAHQVEPRIFDIYLAIDRLNEEMSLKSSLLNDWRQIYEKILIEHGLFLTMIRLKRLTTWKDRSAAFRKNLEHLDKRFPLWYQHPYLNNYSKKAKLMFFLLKHHMFGLLALVYKG